MEPYIIDGVTIERVRAHRPYALMVDFTFGKTLEIERGHDPKKVAEAHNRVARNPKVIDRIYLTDSCGTLMTFWSKEWVSHE